MADDFGVSGMFAGTATTTYTAMLWIFGIAILGGILWLVWFIKQYNKKVIVKVWTNNNYKLIMDKARHVKKDNIDQWHFWNLRVYAQVPPPGAVHTGRKGQEYAEAYYTNDTGIMWATDKTSREKIEQKFKNEPNKGGILEKDAELFVTVEKAMLVDQIKRAMARRGRSGLEVLEKFATPIALIIILFLMLIFWEDITKPNVEVSKNLADVSEQLAIVSEQNARLVTILTGESTGLNITQRINAEGGG